MLQFLTELLVADVSSDALTNLSGEKNADQCSDFSEAVTSRHESQCMHIHSQDLQMIANETCFKPVVLDLNSVKLHPQGSCGALRISLKLCSTKERARGHVKGKQAQLHF